MDSRSSGLTALGPMISQAAQQWAVFLDYIAQEQARSRQDTASPLNCTWNQDNCNHNDVTIRRTLSAERACWRQSLSGNNRKWLSGCRVTIPASAHVPSIRARGSRAHIPSSLSLNSFTYSYTTYMSGIPDTESVLHQYV